MPAPCPRQQATQAARPTCLPACRPAGRLRRLLVTLGILEDIEYHLSLLLPAMPASCRRLARSIRWLGPVIQRVLTLPARLTVMRGSHYTSSICHVRVTNLWASSAVTVAPLASSQCLYCRRFRYERKERGTKRRRWWAERKKCWRVNRWTKNSTSNNFLAKMQSSIGCRSSCSGSDRCDGGHNAASPNAWLDESTPVSHQHTQ